MRVERLIPLLIVAVFCPRGQANIKREGRRVWDGNFCVPTMARSDFPNCKFGFVS